ncbi:UDP-N-acetyl glucosamine 2-epimerase [Planctomycetota bacterium]|nr:UDP-N-acetyl glucosamine 2-epimerase [Planctomycetota bacterium]
MKIVTIVGARPQFIKAAPVSRALRERHQEILVHTGQHYDDNMSGVFFRELGIPEPEVHLGAGGGSHGAQTAAMLTGIEGVLQRERPDRVLVYGDTNSTLAGALAAAKLHVPVAHVEAGLRSFNRRMPEEINRVVTDHLSDLLFCPSEISQRHLAAEGIVSGVHVVGDVMADALLNAARRADASQILIQHQLSPRSYVLATVHRADNTDDGVRLAAILQAFADIGRTILFPVHPRTRKAIAAAGLSVPSNVRPCEPLGYLDLVRALRDADLVLTDSGGLQKEAYWLSVPCITLRDETEWVETVETGWNRIVGADRAAIVAAAADGRRPGDHPALYGGDGQATGKLVGLIQG